MSTRDFFENVWKYLSDPKLLNGSVYSDWLLTDMALLIIVIEYAGTPLVNIIRLSLLLIS